MSSHELALSLKESHVKDNYGVEKMSENYSFLESVEGS